MISCVCWIAGIIIQTEVVSDKISSMLLFFDKVALHVTRPVRWDSDHVVLFDDEDQRRSPRRSSVQALSAYRWHWISLMRALTVSLHGWVGMRNMQKALLYALLLPKRRTGETSGRADFHQTDDAFRGRWRPIRWGCMELFLRDPRCSGKEGTGSRKLRVIWSRSIIKACVIMYHKNAMGCRWKQACTL